MVETLSVIAFLVACIAFLWFVTRGEVVGTMEGSWRTLFGFGSTRRVRLTVRRVAKGRTAALQARVFMGLRGTFLTRANAMRCADLLEKCASEGRVRDDASGVVVGLLEIAPDDLDGERSVALVFRRNNDSMALHTLLSPTQAHTLAGWLRVAVAPGEDLAQARHNARAAH